MAKKLNTDGLPEDVPTNIPDKSNDLFGGVNIDSEKFKKSLNLPEEPPTRIATGAEVSPVSSPNSPFPSSDPVTRVVIGSKKPSDINQPSASTSSNIVSDPVVGWVVIIDGPGKGIGLQIGSGQNTLARGHQARVQIDFGDHEISRESHSIITYDPKHNNYYIQPGLGTNLTYLGEEPVLSPTMLSHGSRIVIGSTTLRFIALCDDSFSWSEN